MNRLIGALHVEPVQRDSHGVPDRSAWGVDRSAGRRRQEDFGCEEGRRTAIALRLSRPHGGHGSVFPIRFLRQEG